MSAASIFLAQGAVRLFRRTDRPSRYWQAAFRRPGGVCLRRVAGGIRISGCSHARTKQMSAAMTALRPAA